MHFPSRVFFHSQTAVDEQHTRLGCWKPAKKDFADSTGREQWALSGQALYLHLEAPEEKALDPGRLASYNETSRKEESKE